MSLTRDDYPLAEKRPDLVRAKSGKPLDAVTLDAVVAGEVGMEDLAISSDALRHQAAIARAVGRPTLAQNFERAADLIAVPADEIMQAYELLRPGRAQDKAEILAAAERLETCYGAALIAAFLREAAEVYAQRGLFRMRF
jgi:propanediol dehydratase small subunit